jgi:tetratricopeptide (TPR) repeat protein
VSAAQHAAEQMDGAPPELARRLDAVTNEAADGRRRWNERTAAERRVRAALDEIGLRPYRDDARHRAELAAAYDALFHEAGFDLDGRNESEVVARLASSSLHDELLAALCEWAVIDRDERHPGRAASLLLAVDREETDGWHRVLLARLMAGDVTALVDLARSRELDSQPVTTTLMLGRIFLRTGHVAAAVTVLQRGQLRFPGDFWINHELAGALQCLDPPRSSAAVGHRRAALAARPDLPAAWSSLGLALRADGQFNEAVRLLQRVVNGAPTSSSGHADLAEAFRLNGELDKALAEYQRAFDCDAHDGDAWVGFALVRAARGQHALALDALQTALRHDPAFVPARVTLGNLLLEMHLSDEALTAFRAAVRCDPTSAAAQFGLGRALAALDRRTEARGPLKRALELQPSHKPAAELLNAIQRP